MVRLYFALLGLSILALVSFGIWAQPIPLESRLGTSLGLQHRDSVILKGLKFEPLEFDFPTPKYSSGPGKISLIELEDKELPFVSLSFHFTNGTQQESLNQAGFLNVGLQLLQQGGTTNVKGHHFSTALTELGASVDLYAGYQSWSLSLKVLKHNFNQAFDLVSKLLLEPALPENQFKDIQNSLLVEIIQKREKPESLARLRIRQLLYPGLRRGHPLEKQDVERMSTKGLRADLLRRIHPEGMYVVMVGDIQSLNIKEKIGLLFKQLSTKVSGPPLVKEEFTRKLAEQRNQKYHSKILLIAKDVTQTVIRIGAYLPAHNHQDFYALQVANYMLGGGSFVSRLMRKVRVEKGLAYYAYSYNRFGADDGIFYAGCGSRNPKAAEALALMLQEIEAVRSKGLTAAELSLAKESLLNGIVFQFDTASKIASEEVRFRLHKMPKQYLQNFPSKIRSIRNKDILQMDSYLKPENLYIVVVGPASLEQQLQNIRPVIVKKPHEKLF